MGRILFDFTGRSVIVTGGARGIGLAVGTAFSDWGADVFLVDLADDPERPGPVADSPGTLTFVECDVTDSSAVDAVVREVVAGAGRVDVLVNNAGILRDGVLWKTTDEDWAAVMDTHAGGTFRFTRAVTPVMRSQSQGRIINVTSYSGLRGNTGQASYSTAKAGIIGFTKTAAKELARFGITVNAISPNASTRMVASIPEEKLTELAAAIPMGRFGDPSEMAPAIGFLASDAAAYVTGVVLPVDGGISL